MTIKISAIKIHELQSNKILKEIFIKTTKQTWSLINELLSKSKCSQSIDKLVINNEIISDENSIAHKFNEYFPSIAEKLNNEIPQSTKTPSNYFSAPVTTSFLFGLSM